MNDNPLGYEKISKLLKSFKRISAKSKYHR